MEGFFLYWVLSCQTEEQNRWSGLCVVWVVMTCVRGEKDDAVEMGDCIHKGLPRI